MNPERLLAKRLSNDPRDNSAEMYLVPHLRAAERVGLIIYESIGEKILKSFGLSSEIWSKRLQKILPLSCLLHDLGKANNWFQELVKGNSVKRQPIRHEFLSVLMILRSKNKLQAYLKTEISSIENEEFYTPLINSIYSGILAHHLKMDIDLKRACPGLYSNGGIPTELISYANAPDFDILFGKDKPTNAFYFSFLSSHTEQRFKSIQTWIDEFQKISSEWEAFLKENEDWYIFSMILKPLVISADVIASALVPKGIEYKNWIIESLQNYIEQNDINRIVLERLNGKSPREFQSQIANSRGRITLVEAGCGSGKTVGAYLWAANNALDSKLFFCYPTTGTATEGYLDYVGDSVYEAKLIHSRSQVDLEGIQKTGEEEENEIADRINALHSYHPKIIICTADTVLSLMKNSRKAILSFASIATGTFVFDEIHSYNDEMFLVLIRFMQLFKNTKFLLMSASLQPDRKELLKRELLNVQEVESPADLMNLPRYKFNEVQESEFLLDGIKKHAGSGKILVVVNTVKRAQTIYRNLITSVLNVKLYHSRYKYMDRVIRHREFISAFKEDSPPVVGVTTQVSEMSLDIDSDILFSELAPIPAIIQRLGRLNRRTTPDNQLPSRGVYFFKPEKPFPYDKADLQLTEKWIENLRMANVEISQNQLQNYFLKLTPESENLYPPIYYDFNKPTFYFMPAIEGLRGPSNTILCILESDFASIKESPKEITNFTIPMTINSAFNFKTANFYKHVVILPDSIIRYDKMEGAKWQN
ncbi:CRISPR-associated helicase Cas3 [Leptospira broomii serovar Hurstbridge str. 5399]|uniref:CRISPR-associated helicase Cas3 n=1 Tax=Leptospira broomii serovar Hurstbridge str. 5399 TaxID=1049789 RepID=T0EYT7_9LEPT|nr:CRISPR-associated helicase/endonuclease Cas3 [Leptospira broomii]EQA44025.1 CRISPR-associated helicase Cas3 [Leptospira broomii serovar Hurstbridge str. 5399]